MHWLDVQNLVFTEFRGRWFDFDSSPPALSSFEEEREIVFDGLITQGCARVASLALGYHLSGFQPFQFGPTHVGCYAQFTH